MKRLNSNFQYPPPGSPVFVWVRGLVKHYGIVSDRRRLGSPMVISNSRRSRQTREEPWSVFCAGEPAYLASHLQPKVGGMEVVRRARHWQGRPYDLVFRNCDHHVRYSLGLSVRSPQLRFVATITLVAIGVGLWSGSSRRRTA